MLLETNALAEFDVERVMGNRTHNGYVDVEILAARPIVDVVLISSLRTVPDGRENRRMNDIYLQA